RAAPSRRAARRCPELVHGGARIGAHPRRRGHRARASSGGGPMSDARSMTLRELLPGEVAGAAADLRVRGLALDSRRIEPGHAFVALAGLNAHGITFAPAASARGAVVVLADPAGLPASAPTAASRALPVVWIDNLRERVGSIAARFFGEPTRALRVTGVTGTNGKTSTVHLLAQALARGGRRAATIGTLGAGLHGA